jgi:hypothetical protein
MNTQTMYQEWKNKKQQEFTDVFSQLPNNLIMDIIKIADGGLNRHKKGYQGVMEEFLGLKALEYIEDGCPRNEAFIDVLKGQDTCIKGAYVVNGDYFKDEDASPLEQEMATLWTDRLGLSTAMGGLNFL